MQKACLLATDACSCCTFVGCVDMSPKPTKAQQLHGPVARGHVFCIDSRSVGILGELHVCTTFDKLNIVVDQNRIRTPCMTVSLKFYPAKSAV